MNVPLPLRRFLALAAGALVFAAVLRTAACGPSGAIRAAIPDAALAEAPWEQAYAPDELTDDVSGIVSEPANAEPGAPLVPSAGARVELLLPRPDGRAPLVKIAETTTGADGTWRLGKVPPDTWAVRVSKPGVPTALGGARVRVHGALDITRDGEGRIILLGFRTLRGLVVTPDGRPAAGVPVDAMGMAYFEATTTAPDGTFEFRPPITPVRVSTRSTTWDVAATIVPPDQADVRLETRPSPEFAGRVVAAEDLRPIAGARVVSLEDPSIRTTTDDDGRFRLPMPRVGWVGAFAAGRALRPYQIPVAADLEMLLYAAPAVTGTVVDAEGRPVEDARLVGLSSDMQGTVLRVDGPRSGPGGRFDFSWVGTPPSWTGRRSAIVAWHRRLGVSQPVVLPSEGPIVLRLSGLGTVRGTFTDSSGAPVAAAKAFVAWRMEPLTDEETSTLGLTTDRQDITGPDGSFEIPGVPLDRSRTAGVEAYGVRLDRVLEPGAPTHDIRFTRAAGHRLAGRVADWKGRAPGAPARVTARLLDVPGVSFERAQVTADDGAFEFRDVPEGRYALEAEAQGFDVRGGGAAHAGDGNAILTVRRLAKLSARFVPETGGVPSVPFTVWVDDLDRPGMIAGRRQLGAGAADGDFAVAALHPGRYRVRAEGDVWRGWVAEIVLADGEVRTLDVPLQRTLTLRGTLVDEAGRPLPSEQVTLVPLAGTPGQSISSRSSDTGAVEVVGVHPGRWEVRASPPFRAALTTTVTLPAEQPFEFRLPPCGELIVRVRTADGRPAADAIVGLDAEDGSAIYAWSGDATQRNARFRAGEDGAVRIRGVPAGRVRITAAVAGGRTRLAPRDVVVEAGAKPLEVEFE